MEKLEKVEQKLEKVQQKFEENSLALEMLRELKKSAKRKFIIIIILVIALIGTNVGWLIYNAQFETIEEVETTQEQLIKDIEGANNSNFSQEIN